MMVTVYKTAPKGDADDKAIQTRLVVSRARPTQKILLCKKKKKQFQNIRKIRLGIKMNGKFTWPSVAVYRGGTF